MGRTDSDTVKQAVKFKCEGLIHGEVGKCDGEAERAHLYAADECNRPNIVLRDPFCPFHILPNKD